MIFGISFGKKKTSQQSSTDTNIKENTNQSQSQSTTGQTSTNTSQTGTTNQSTTGTQSSDTVDRQNQTTTGSTTQTGTTTTLDQGIQDQLSSALSSLLGGINNESSSAISNAATGLLDFDPVSFVNDSVAAARNRGEQTLQESNSALGSAIGGPLPTTQWPPSSPSVVQMILQRLWLASERARLKLLLKSRAEMLQQRRSEEHTSELQSLMRISYAVFCLKKKITKT